MPYIIAMNIVKFSSVYQEWLHVLFENLTSNQGFDVETAPGGGAVSISDIHYRGGGDGNDECNGNAGNGCIQREKGHSVTTSTSQSPPVRGSRLPSMGLPFTKMLFMRQKKALKKGVLSGCRLIRPCQKEVSGMHICNRLLFQLRQKSF